jgi:DNA-binding transcriptional LysR family regulator
MEDRLLKFARLVDAGSFTRAAEEMHISQPALTTAIKKLERELRTELLIRANHTLTLTEAGQVAYKTAKAIAAQTHNLKADIATTANVKPTLRLGLIDGLADLLFVHGEHLTELEQKTRLSLTVDNTSRLITYVDHDKLDLALIAKPAILPRTLQVIPLGDEPLVVVTHTERLDLTIQELKQREIRGFLAYNQSSHTYKLVDGFLRSQGIGVAYSFYSTSPEIMLALLREGRGIAALPYPLIEPFLASGELAQVPIAGGSVIARPITAIQRQGRHLTPHMEELLEATEHKLRDANLSCQNKR